MATPTVYDEDALAAFMLNELDDTARVLGITASPDVTGDFGPLTEPVNNVLFDLGTDDLATFTSRKQLRQVRAVAAVHAWRFAAKRAATRYDMQDGTTKLTRSQLQSQITKNLSQAELTAAALGVLISGKAPQVRIGRLRFPQDPYRPIDESPTGLNLATDFSP